MTSTEIQTKWDDSIATYQIRVGTSRIKNPGNYARVSLSGTDRSAGVFHVDPVDNTLRDKENLDKYIKLHPNVAETLGYPPSEERLIRERINVRVEAPVPETALTTCSGLTIYSEDIGEEILKTYLTNRKYIVRPITEAVPIDDIERHTPYSFDHTDEFATFEVVDLSPSRHSLVVRGSTDITVREDPPQQPDSIGGSPPDGSISDSTTDGPSRDGPGDEQGDDAGEYGTYDESEVGEGFDISPEPPEHTFDDIVGLDAVKERVSNLTALTNDDFVEDLEDYYGDEVQTLLPDGYTMLLYGPPGCGKTMVSHAIADRFQKQFDTQPGSESVAFISVKGSDILASLQGQSESRVEAVFTEARRAASEEGYAILFFDEIETLIPDRNSASTEATNSRLTVAFLQEMNSIADNVMIIGATNLPFSIDSAASRRFKTKLFVPHPGEEALAELWTKNLSSLNTDGQIDYDELGSASTDFTPSEIDAMLETEVQSDIVEGMLEDDPQPLTTDYLLGKLEDMQPRVVEEYVSSVDQPSLIGGEQMQGYRELEEYIETYTDRFDGTGNA